MKTIQNILIQLNAAELRQIFWNALSSRISKKLNSPIACSTVAKAMADVKPVSLNSVLYSEFQNSENFDFDRNQNDGKNDLHKRVCESRLLHRFGFVPAAGRIFTVSYFLLFRRPVRRSFNVGESVLTKANALPAPSFVSGLHSLDKNAFYVSLASAFSSMFKMVLNAFSPSVHQPLGLGLIDRWTNRLLALNRSAKSRFATVQPISPLAFPMSTSCYQAILLFSYLAISLLPAFSAPPTWWTTQNVLDTTKTANDYAAVNQGQLKAIAKKAITEMNAKLPGGAGTELNDLLTTWSAVNASRNDYTAVNIGQVKALAKKFYDRLNAVGVNAPYPWSTVTTDDKDYAAANIGQVKNAFSFLIHSGSNNNTDSDNLLDAWELQYFPDLSSADNDDPDGDGVTNLNEFINGTDPTDSRSVRLIYVDGVNGSDLNTGQTKGTGSSGPKQTIQGGLISAEVHDSIQVQSGNYSIEVLIFSGSKVRIKPNGIVDVTPP